MPQLKQFTPSDTANTTSERNRTRRREKKEIKRRPLLDMGRLYAFKYDMNQLLTRSDLEPTVAQSFMATIIAKGSRVSIQDAKDYILEMEQRDDMKVSKRLSEEVQRLLDRYTKWR